MTLLSGFVSRCTLMVVLTTGVILSPGGRVLSHPGSIPSQLHLAQNESTPELAEAILGQWFSPSALGGEPLTFIFTEAGVLHFIVTLPRGRTVSQEFSYEVGAGSPHAIDLILPNGDRVATIAEMTDSGTLRFQIEGTEPGSPRPDAFDENVAEFERVSTSTELPARLVEANALDVVIDISRAQRTHYLEFREFADSMEPLNAEPVPLETDDYRIEINRDDGSGNQVRITATAKREDLRSFTSGVFMVPNERGLEVSLVGICRSDEPDLTAPAMPIPPETAEGTVTCAPGSHLMER
ncbi:MAG: type IV pilin-like G/H family protein [Phormidium sp. BM_Day4_Bin.17]|nr:type IV pilin-like G/H family protein [Phormidium sp. BM_Day4_Bin.17]UCJ10477.1 MAG: hypothetical protein JWS08_11445 [Phormidium sp. PBR-2020]